MSTLPDTVLLHHHDSDHCCHGFWIYLVYVLTYARSLFVLAGVALITGLVGLGLLLFSLVWIRCWRPLQKNLPHSFIQWYYWSSNIGPLVILCIGTGVLEYFSQCIIELTVRHPPQELHSNLHQSFCELKGIIGIIRR